MYIYRIYVRWYCWYYFSSEHRGKGGSLKSRLQFGYWHGKTGERTPNRVTKIDRRGLLCRDGWRVYFFILRNVQIKRKDVIKTSVCVTNWITAELGHRRAHGRKLRRREKNCETERLKMVPVVNPSQQRGNLSSREKRNAPDWEGCIIPGFFRDRTAWVQNANCSREYL